jgi:hypothetical protein
MGVRTCPVCHLEARPTKWRISTSKTGIFCCSRKCKDELQRGDILFDGSDKIAHRVGSGHSAYRKRALRSRAACVDCGISHPGILVVHHIDGDRGNGLDDNLEVLCPQHHALRHLRLDGDGQWVFHPLFLTPRDMLEKLLVFSFPPK